MSAVIEQPQGLLCEPPQPGVSVWQANERAWGQRRLWPYMPMMERLLSTDAKAPALLDVLVHQSTAQRSGGLVESLKVCLKDNPGMTQLIQRVGPGLKDDRLERLEITREGDHPGIESGKEVIVRIEEFNAPRHRG